MNDEEFKESVTRWCRSGMVLENSIKEIYEECYSETSFASHLSSCRQQSLVRIARIVRVSEGVKSLNNDYYRDVVRLLPGYHPACVYAKRMLGEKE